MNKLLKAKIVERFGSQTEFAKAVREHESIVSRVIRGHHGLTADERRRWAIALGCEDTAKLFGLSDR